MSNLENLIEKGAELVGISYTEGKKYSKYLQELDAVYIANPIRGGAAIIIHDMNDFLYATSAVSFEEHQKAFFAGKRTDPSVFQS